MLLATAPLSVVHAAEPLKIAVKPLAPVNKADTEAVRKAIATRFRADVRVLPSSRLPKTAYYAPRNRYRAERLLTWLDANTDKDYAKVIGITSRDISTTRGDVVDWGIFGLGAIDLRPCVLSTFRLGGGVSQKKRRERLQKIAVHEAGHTFGLPHCPKARCMMNDARGSIKTVDAETGFCKKCVARLGGNLRP
ncbi:MAG: hypothetical protein H7Y38_05100 [Armatimonadetes bacterium]|nr:hypothetical protein [Armatimonadota bacterium]